MYKNSFIMCFFTGCRYLYHLYRSILNRILGTPPKYLQGSQDHSYVELYDQQANDYIFNLLSSGSPCMVSKFGTIELNMLAQLRIINNGGYHLKDIKSFIMGKIPRIELTDALSHLINNAGFFPNNESLLPNYYEENINAIRNIDVLGSYVSSEMLFNKDLSGAKRVNLDGYYAPFYWERPWTRILEGKKVLVIHPFSEEIMSQYRNNRKRIWTNPEVLPEFELITYKAVQSILGVQTEYASWFDALQKMKDDIALIDFDIALVGCGAYGMPLAAYCKILGKQAIHLAGWLQVLFGIIGKRWENNPRVSPLINEYWIRPFDCNVPKDAVMVEDACYW